jgi:hypothetical protein
VIWLTGENGAIMSFSEPLPAVIEAQVARGTLRPLEPPREAITVPVVPDTAGAGEKLQATLDEGPPDKPPPEPQPSSPPPGPGPVRAPSVRASAGAWRAYAVSQGVPAGKAAAMTKSALISRFTKLRAVS